MSNVCGILLLAFASVSLLKPDYVFAQTLAQLIDGAKKEGQLILSWGTGTMGGIEGAEAMEKAFNKTYGLNLQFKYTPGPAMPQFASRIIQEAKAGQPSSTDLYVGSENHVARMPLRSVEWPQIFPHITAAMTDFDNKVLIVTTRTPGFSYNTKLVSAKDMPQKLEDTLLPKWKGKIASTPYAASFDRLAMIWGEEKATVFLNKFVKQVAGLIRCGEDERIASGEFAMLVFNCDLASPQEAKEKGEPVDGQVFKDAGILSYWYVTVPSNSRNPNGATLLAAFLLTKDGQDLLYKTERSSSHLVKGTQMNQFIAEQEKRGVKFVTYSVSEVVKNADEQSRIRQKFQKILAGN
ncbi:MAG TPA: ABC transporter substrate-binding protein [Acidobacteriota bacterium]|nr:ABC transporter substrate-binding protein [Acidobacteriota bacterium]